MAPYLAHIIRNPGNTDRYSSLHMLRPGRCSQVCSKGTETHFILVFPLSNSIWPWRVGPINLLLHWNRARNRRQWVKQDINQRLCAFPREDEWATFNPLSATRPLQQSTVQIIVLTIPRMVDAMCIHSLETLLVYFQKECNWRHFAGHTFGGQIHVDSCECYQQRGPKKAKHLWRDSLFET